ncbi:MAG: uracil-DNA glycosylase [Gemmatimonadetes bacterium]|nr:uracil-DNA glycosylase [Gemmatimonadota bacterium]NNM06627.1 uracil-DNA glycosylase [Gemmatimonadota bacterium]
MDIGQIQAEVAGCRRCPRLVAWREEVARKKRAAYSHEDYWGRPVPGFGDPNGRLLVVGLAPAAHGANRTGRMFTGDRSGDWLYRALHRVGFANQSQSTHSQDGLRLTDCFVTAAVRCAPPDNKPTPLERDTCRSFLEAELEVLEGVHVAVALGKFAFDQIWRILKASGEPLPTPRSRFGHGLEVSVRPGLTLLASFHPSQQNTFTGRLTEEMFGQVWARARDLLTESPTRG